MYDFDYLEKLREDETDLTIFLANGVKLVGKIRVVAYNPGETVHCFILDRDGQCQLVMMAHVATVLPKMGG